jgi:hypothetical protein
MDFYNQVINENVSSLKAMFYLLIYFKMISYTTILKYITLQLLLKKSKWK